MTGRREPTVVVSARVPARFLAKIDEERGGKSRGGFYALQIARGIGEESAEALPLDAPAPVEPAALEVPAPTAPDPAPAPRPAPDPDDCPHTRTKPRAGSVSGLRQCEDCGEVGMGLGRR